jgi:retron-type reverse transcriptase
VYRQDVLEADFTDNAYGYRPGRSAHEAILDVDASLGSGYTEVVDADLSKYFETIPHDESLHAVGTPPRPSRLHHPRPSRRVRKHHDFENAALGNRVRRTDAPIFVFTSS